MSFKKALWISGPVVLALLLGGCKYSVERGGYDLSSFRRDPSLVSVPEELKGVVASNGEALRAILSEKPGPDLRFAVIGDTVSNDNRTFKGFLGEIAALEPRPSFIIHLGDRAASPVIESYGAYFRDIRGAPCPIIHVNGNHDLREEGDRISHAFFGAGDFFFDLGDMRFIFMDDNPEHGLRGGHGGFSPAQLAWLEDKLKAPWPERKFFFAHIPPRAPFKKIDPGLAALFTPPIANEEAFLGLLARYHVVMAAFGHRHVHAEQLYQGVLMVITGGGGQRTTFNPQVDVPRFTKKHHYTLVDIPGPRPFGTFEGTLSCMAKDHQVLSAMSFFQPNLIAGGAAGAVELEPLTAQSGGTLGAGPRPSLFRHAAASQTR